MEYSIAILKNDLTEIGILLAETKESNLKYPKGIWNDVIARYKEIIKDLEVTIKFLEKNIKNTTNN